MEDQLYMLEILVHNILFPILPVPQKKQLVVQVTCGHLINTEIRTDIMGALETKERSSKRKDVDIECGKSLIFSMNAAALKTVLKNNPLELTLYKKPENEPMGSQKIPWAKEFIDMVDVSESRAFGRISPVEFFDKVPLTNDDSDAGKVDMYLRLSCLGKNIDTCFEIAEKSSDDGGKAFYFQTNKAPATYHCQKMGLGSDTDIIPVGPIYGMTGRQGHHRKGKKEKNSSSSIQSLLKFASTMGSNYSIVPSVFKEPQDMINPLYGVNVTDDDAISIKGNAPDMRFFDIREMGLLGSDIDSDDFSPESLTIEKINRNLCDHPDCPVAKLFANWGIGPLATGSGLGGLYNQIEAPVTYGMSQLPGNLVNYGPLGTTKRLDVDKQK